MNLLIEAWGWLADPVQWSGAGSIPARVGQHVLICLVVVVCAAIIALPAGILIGHTGRGRGLVVAGAGAIRAIPTLGLLTLLALWLGIGVQAPIIALIVLAIPSILGGAYAGVESVDRRTIDGARASGMTPWQVITRVELPLGAPVIIGGLRAATLQVVATATLAAYVSDTGLGRFIFRGLKTLDYPQMLGGALLVAALAIIFEAILALVQNVSTRLADPARAPRGRVTVKGTR